MASGARALARCLLALEASGGGSVVVCRLKANTHTHVCLGGNTHAALSVRQRAKARSGFGMKEAPEACARATSHGTRVHRIFILDKTHFIMWRW